MLRCKERFSRRRVFQHRAQRCGLTKQIIVCGNDKQPTLSHFSKREDYAAILVPPTGHCALFTQLRR
jgi:hypothetical protein